MPATRRPGSGAPDEPTRVYETRVYEWHAAGSRLGNEFNSARENLTPAQKGYVSEQLGEQYSTELNEKVLGRQSQGDRDLKQIAQGIDGVYIDAPCKEIVCVEAKGQGGRASQPHSPKVCLPGAGWTPEAISDVTIDTTAGAITVNRYVVSKGQQRAIVLYWYQTPRRVVAGEWSAKFWLVADALRDQRTDTSMVRVLTWVQGNADSQATTDVLGFAREVYPVLRQHLPR